MNCRFLAFAFVALVAQAAPARDADRPMAVTADLDGNGEMDIARLTRSGESVGLRVTINSTPLPAIEIPVDGSREFGICPGSPPSIRIVAQSEAPLNALGEMPHGYAMCPTCVEIEVGGGDCDPVHFYWDVIAGKLAWWRA